MTTLTTPTNQTSQASHAVEQPVPAEADLLQRYFEDECPDCPDCGYNLRGTLGDRCPECGGILRLSLRATPMIRRRAGLLVLLLLWLFFAGTMNAIRAGQGIRSVAQAQQWVQVAMPNLQQGVLRRTLGNVDIDIRTSGGPNGSRFQGPFVISPPAPGANLPAVAIRSNAPPMQIGTPAWSRVGWSLWAGLAWWVSLGLAAGVALALLVRYRHASASSRVQRVVMLIAWLGFGGYFAYHGYSFAMEFV